MEPLKLLQLAHITMVGGFVLCIGSIYLAYGVQDSLSLGMLIIAHLSLIPFATLFKFGYIARLVALKRLGRAVD